MLQVRKDEISLRKCSGGSAQLPTFEGTLVVAKESARCDNNDSEPKSQVRLLKFPEENKNFQRHILSKAFCHFPNVRMKMNVFRRGNCRPQSGRILK